MFRAIAHIVYRMIGISLAIMIGYGLAHCECSETEARLMYDYGRSYQLGRDFAVNGDGNLCRILTDSKTETFASDWSEKIRVFFIKKCEEGFLDASRSMTSPKQLPRYDSNPKFNF